MYASVSQLTTANFMLNEGHDLICSMLQANVLQLADRQEANVTDIRWGRGLSANYTRLNESC